MGCRRYRNSLSEAAAGTLAPEHRRELDEHLAQCAQCAARLDRLRRASDLIHHALAESAAADPSPEWLRGVERRLQAEAKSPRRRGPYGVLIAVAAAIALVLTAWALHGRFITRSPSATSPPPVTATAHRQAPAATAKSEVAARAKKPSVPRPARSAASTRPLAHLAHRRPPRLNRQHFALVKVQPEREAVIRLYDLLQSGKIDPQSLLKPEQSVDKPIVIPPLHIQPLEIPPIDMKSDSGPGQGQSFGSGRSNESRVGANKEKTP
jgi:hypothetical protein